MSDKVLLAGKTAAVNQTKICGSYALRRDENYKLVNQSFSTQLTSGAVTLLWGLS